MPSTRDELRHVMLGSLFTPEVPLGLTRGILITCHVSATGKGKLHGIPECRTLRSAASVNQIDVPFGEAVARLCPSCRWPLPTDSLILPLGAAVSEVDSLAIWLDRESKDEEDLEVERDAATALTAGEYPPPATESGDEEEKDDDEAGHDEEWKRYDRARNFRSRRQEHWRRLHSYLTRSNDAVSEYPFLAPWADGLQSRLATALDEERRAFAALVQPIRLLEAAAVHILPEPKFSPNLGFAGLGAEAEKTFRRAWYEWSRRAVWSWRRLENQDFSVYTVVSDAFGRRRKGKPEAHAAFRRLTADWIRQAREEAGRPVSTPWQLVAAKAPALVRSHHSEPERDPLTLWEAAVIATYQVAFNRKAGTTALLVPLAAEGRCRPLAFVLTPGHYGDGPQLERVLEKVSVPRTGVGRPRTRPDRVLADKAYMSRRNRRYLRRRGIPHTIPERLDQQRHRKNRGSRGGRPTGFDSERYKKRNTVERTINRLKGFRAVATRYEKRAYIYLGTVTLAALLIWLRT